MILPDFNVEHLKALPLRAIVAFATRCARRVEPLAQLPEGNPHRESRRGAIDAALRMAEAFARGDDAHPDESVITAIDASRDAGGELAVEDAVTAASQAAHAAASAWHAEPERAEELRPRGGFSTEARHQLGGISHITADLAALNSFTAAQNACLSVGYRNEAFVGAALRDYNTLVSLELGHYPEPGAPVDPSPNGPLGPL
jgi:hypothetical protein